MRDNKPIEKQAENYLKSQLSKFDFNYQEPSYDKNGSDLTIIENYKAKKMHLKKRFLQRSQLEVIMKKQTLN